MPFSRLKNAAPDRSDAFPEAEIEESISSTRDCLRFQPSEFRRIDLKLRLQSSERGSLLGHYWVVHTNLVLQPNS